MDRLSIKGIPTFDLASLSTVPLSGRLFSSSFLLRAKALGLEYVRVAVNAAMFNASSDCRSQ